MLSTDQIDYLTQAIEASGYYPNLVLEGVASSIAGEPVLAFLVHHEPTISADEVRRHLTVLTLTPSRLLLTHTDEYPGDELLPQPYTATSTESVALTQLKGVAINRIVPISADPKAGPAEAVLTINFGGIQRFEVEAANCGDPNCEANHGFAGVLGSDDFSLRLSQAADGENAVLNLLNFGNQLSLTAAKLKAE